MNSTGGNYAKLSTSEEEYLDRHAIILPKEDIVEEGEEEGEGGDLAVPAAITCETPSPMSRMPATPRDSFFVLLFLLHFAVVGLFFFCEKRNNRDTFIHSSKEGLWSSMIMIVTLMGAFFGALVVFTIANPDARDSFLTFSLYVSIILRICLGNIILFTKSKYSFIGIAMLLSALIDSNKHNKAVTNMNFTSALLGLVGRVCKLFGSQLVLACSIVSVVQFCVLLWWGVFLVQLLSSVSLKYFDLLALVMVFSLYWIIQFFRAVISFIVGGCVLWAFVHPEDAPLAPNRRLWLLVQCTCVSHLGSIIKSSLLAPVAHVVLGLYLWLLKRQGISVGNANCCSVIPRSNAAQLDGDRRSGTFNNNNKQLNIAENGGFDELIFPLADDPDAHYKLSGSCCCSCFSRSEHPPLQNPRGISMTVHSNGGRTTTVVTGKSWCCCCCCCGASCCSFSECLLRLITPMVSTCRQYHRFSLPLLSLYGRTLCKEAMEFVNLYPHVVELGVRDSTSYVLSSAIMEISGILTIFFGLLAGWREGHALPVFLLLVYALCFAGVSLAVQVYQAAVDAIHIAYALAPDRLNKLDQIIYLRFVRSTDPSLVTR